MNATTRGFALSLAITSVVNALLVIAKESSPRVMAEMKHLVGHHWAAHSLLVVVLFLVLGLIFSRLNGGQGIKMTPPAVIRAVVGGAAAGILIIAGFYLAGG